MTPSRVVISLRLRVTTRSRSFHFEVIPYP